MKSFVLSLLFCLATATAANAVQWGGANSNTPPFNYLSMTTSSYQIPSINSMKTSVVVKTNTSLAKTITLKGCTAANKGDVVTIIDADVNASTYNITITPSTGTINSAASYIISGNGATIDFVCDGTSNWLTAHSNIGGVLSLATYGGLGNDSTDEVTAFNTMIAACNARTNGGTMYVPRGIYRISAALTSITKSGCQLYFEPGTVLKPTGTWGSSTAIIKFSGTGPGATTVTLSTNATKHTNTFTTADASSLSVDGYVVFQKAAPGNTGDVYKFISRIRAISGAGPYTVDINDAFPLTFGTGDSGILVKAWTPIENVGISGGVRCDGSSHTTGTWICIQANNVAYSRFENIQGTSIAPEEGLLFYAADTAAGTGGYFNIFNDINGVNIGGDSTVAIGFLGQTHGTFTNIKAAGGLTTGFGVQWQECAYVTASNIHSVGYSQVSGIGRGIKIQSTVGGNFTNIISNNSGDNGLAITEGSGDLNFFGVTANNNKTSEGVWFNGNNFNIRMFGVHARGNASFDIAIQEGDTDIEIWGADFSSYKNRGGAFIQKVGEPAVAPNMLINPQMTHDQENEGTAVALVSAAAAAYIADGWQAAFTSGGGNTVSCQRVSDGPDNFSNSLKCTTTGAAAIQAGDYLTIRQPVEASFLEGTNLAAATGKSLCATFWAKSSIANYDITGVISNYARDRVWVPAELFNIPTADTWTKFKFCAPANSGGAWVTSGLAGGAYLTLTGASGSSGLTSAGWKTSNFYGLTGADTGLLTTNGATFQISKVKLEAGYGATPFQLRDPVTELSLIQRYFEKSYDIGVAPGTASATTGEEIYSLFGTTNGTYRFPIRYTVTKRCIPSNPGVKVYSPVSGSGGSGINGFVRQTAVGEIAVNALGQAGYKGIFVQVVMTPGANDAVTYHWTANCRLD